MKVCVSVSVSVENTNEDKCRQNVHIMLTKHSIQDIICTSLTFSRTMLKCLSKALMDAKSFLLFLQLMRILERSLTAFVSRDKGPSTNSFSSKARISSIVISDFSRVLEEGH